MWVSTVLVGVIAGLLAHWLWGLWKYRQIFVRAGIPGPKPNFLFGNSGELLKKGFHPCLKDWSKKYGKTFGAFGSEAPMLITSDLELLRKVFVTNFNNFMNRTPIPFQSESDPYIDMFRAANHRWKKIRRSSTPAFSNSKVKKLAPVVNHVVGRTVERMGKLAKDAGVVEVYDEFQCLTLDLIGNVAFGIDLGGSQNMANDIFRAECMKVVNLSEHLTFSALFWIILSMISPGFVTFVMANFRSLNPFQATYLRESAKKIILERQADPNLRREDFIQYMLEHGRQDEDRLTLEEMQGKSLLFLVAGHETTATTLSFVTYELALHPDIHDRLQSEIDEAFPDKDPDMSSGDLDKLGYLDMVVNETLRLHPIGPFATERVCASDITLDGIFIPKGMKIQANMKAVHMDPELWGPEDPEEFVPERFEAERKGGRNPLAFMPFGAGPRNCIGWRFALLEAKITLVRMLKRFNFRRCPETKVPLDLTPQFIERPSAGVYVRVEERE